MGFSDSIKGANPAHTRRKGSGWTPERKARQAELIKQYKPWVKSTGPRTLEGKVKASRNAYKGGHWLQMRELSKMVNAEVRRAHESIASAGN